MIKEESEEGERADAVQIQYFNMTKEMTPLPMSDPAFIEFPRILIVDDQVFNIDALLIMLKVSKIDDGTHCHKAFNGVQAVDQVRAQNVLGFYHIIFMDCQMPHLDGYQATIQIREYCSSNGIHQPVIIAVTGHSEEAYVEIALKAGMNRVISKPANIKEIQDVIQEARSNI